MTARGEPIRSIRRPPAAPAFIAIYPFAYTTEVELPAGSAPWEESDAIASGTEILLLLVVIVATAWHVVRVVAPQPQQNPQRPG